MNKQSINPRPLEQQLFIWESWSGDASCVNFSRCTLSTDVGKFKKGSIVENIAMDYEHSKIKIWSDSGELLESRNLLISLE